MKVWRGQCELVSPRKFKGFFSGRHRHDLYFLAVSYRSAETADLDETPTDPCRSPHFDHNPSATLLEQIRLRIFGIVRFTPLVPRFLACPGCDSKLEDPSPSDMHSRNGEARLDWRKNDTEAASQVPSTLAEMVGEHSLMWRGSSWESSRSVEQMLLGLMSGGLEAKVCGHG